MARGSAQVATGAKDAQGLVVKLDRGYPLVRMPSGECVRCEHATALVKGARVRAVIGDEVSVEIPSNYSVEIGGKTLDSSYITQKNISYEILEPLEDYLKDLPVKERYQYGPVLGAGEITVLDSKGQTVPEEVQTEHHYLVTASAADRARVKEFVDRYLAVYLPFADDLEHRGMGYFDAVYQMIIHGGDIERRIRQAIDGLEYGNVLKLEILSVDLDCCTDLGGGRFFTDFSYHIRTYGLTDPTEETYRMRLLLKEEYGTLYAEQMYLS